MLLSSLYAAAVDPVTGGIRRVALHPESSRLPEPIFRRSHGVVGNLLEGVHLFDLQRSFTTRWTNLFQSLFTRDRIDFCSCPPVTISVSDLKCVAFQALTLRCFNVSSQTESWWSQSYSNADIVSALLCRHLVRRKSSTHRQSPSRVCSSYHGTPCHWTCRPPCTGDAVTVSLY